MGKILILVNTSLLLAVMLMSIVIHFNQKKSAPEIEPQLQVVDHRLTRLESKLAQTVDVLEKQPLPEPVPSKAKDLPVANAEMPQADSLPKEEGEAVDDTAELSNATAQPHFEGELREMDWAYQQEVEIAATVENLAPEGEVLLERVDCRSQSCRLELIVDESAPLHTRSLLVGELGRTLPYAYWSKNEGPSVELILSTLDPNPEH